MEKKSRWITPPPGSYRHESPFDRPKIKGRCLFGGKYLSQSYESFPGPGDYNVIGDLKKSIRKRKAKEKEKEKEEKDDCDEVKARIAPLAPNSYILGYSQTDINKSFSFSKGPRVPTNARANCDAALGPGQYKPLESKFDLIVQKMKRIQNEKRKYTRRHEFNPRKSIQRERRYIMLIEKIQAMNDEE